MFDILIYTKFIYYCKTCQAMIQIPNWRSNYPWFDWFYHFFYHLYIFIIFSFSKYIYKLFLISINKKFWILHSTSNWMIIWANYLKVKTISYITEIVSLGVPFLKFSIFNLRKQARNFQNMEVGATLETKDLERIMQLSIYLHMND